MKIKGKHTTTQMVDVEIGDDQIRAIVHSQSVDCLAKALKEKLLYEFTHSLEPGFVGKRCIYPARSGKHAGHLVLVHIDADWNYHNDVGEDEEVRALTKEEAEKYHTLYNLDIAITDLQK